MRLQPGNQRPFDIDRQGGAVSHGVHGVGIDQVDHRLLVIPAIQIRFNDFNRSHWGLSFFCCPVGLLFGAIHALA